MGKLQHSTLSIPLLNSDAHSGTNSVASIYFPNDTAVDIAKIEGGRAYRQTMHLVGVNSQAPTTLNLASENSVVAGLGWYQTMLGSLSPGYRHLPWFGGHDKPAANSFTPMLKSLKAATEAYLEVDDISHVGVSLPFRVDSLHKLALQSALASLSLDSGYGPGNAGISAAFAYGLGKDFCDPYPDPPDQLQPLERLILAVGHNRASLTAVLIDEECGVFEERRTVHDTEVGADALDQRCEGSVDDDSKCLAGLTKALRQVTDLPLRDGNGAGITRISNLIFHGDAIDDPRLHHVLKQVLLEQYGVNTTTFVDRRTEWIHPLFAASRGMAQTCLLRLQDDAFE